MIESHQPETVEPIATMRTFAGFVTMCIGMFMAILDVQIVATSLPTIQRALGIAPDEMSWVQTAYLIAEIVAIPLTGFLMRLIGMRRLFGAAVLAFAVASLGCAMSGHFAQLLVWRVVQGFAGGMLSLPSSPPSSCSFRCGFRGRRPRSPACWRSSPRPSGRSLAGGSPRLIHGTGFSLSMSGRALQRRWAGLPCFRASGRTGSFREGSICCRWSCWQRV